MIGHGFRHLLSIHRAAVACFVVSGAATVGILIYVALAIMAAAEVAHGLYLLAAIELLLKLTAVSAIIVLITLRRTTAMVLPASQANGEHVAAALEAQEDRGRLEFGSLAFAFGLVVIFRKSGDAVESLAANDDSGKGGFPRLRTELTAGETFYLVLQHFAPGGAPVATARIDVRPDMPPANEEAQPVDQTEPLVPAPATEAETPQP